MLTEACAIGILCRAVWTSDGACISDCSSTIVATWRRPIARTARCSAAMPPTMVIFRMAAVMIAAAVVAAVAVSSLVTTQQHVK